MNTTEEFIAYVERDARVIEEIRQTLFVLELVNLSDVRVEGTTLKLVFSREIQRLKHVLRLVGASDD